MNLDDFNRDVINLNKRYVVCGSNKLEQYPKYNAMKSEICYKIEIEIKTIMTTLNILKNHEIVDEKNINDLKNKIQNANDTLKKLEKLDELSYLEAEGKSILSRYPSLKQNIKKAVDLYKKSIQVDTTLLPKQPLQAYKNYLMQNYASEFSKLMIKYKKISKIDLIKKATVICEQSKEMIFKKECKIILEMINSLDDQSAKEYLIFNIFERKNDIFNNINIFNQMEQQHKHIDYLYDKIKNGLDNFENVLSYSQNLAELLPLVKMVSAHGNIFLQRIPNYNTKLQKIITLANDVEKQFIQILNIQFNINIKTSQNEIVNVLCMDPKKREIITHIYNKLKIITQYNNNIQWYGFDNWIIGNTDSKKLTLIFPNELGMIEDHLNYIKNNKLPKLQTSACDINLLKSFFDVPLLLRGGTEKLVHITLTLILIIIIVMLIVWFAKNIVRIYNQNTNLSQ